MKNIIFRLIKKQILNFIGKEVISDEFKKRLIDRINNLVNIPGLDEKQEAEIIAKIIEGATGALTDHFS
jgi:hypothetical protein